MNKKNERSMSGSKKFENSIRVIKTRQNRESAVAAAVIAAGKIRNKFQLRTLEKSFRESKYIPENVKNYLLKAAENRLAKQQRDSKRRKRI